MKYLKSFEYFEIPKTKVGQALDYEVGDIVVCIQTQYDDFGVPKIFEEKYFEVLNIYTIPEDKFLNNPYMRVDIKDLETDKIYRGFRSDAFKAQAEFFADKFNM